MIAGAILGGFAGASYGLAGMVVGGYLGAAIGSRKGAELGARVGHQMDVAAVQIAGVAFQVISFASQLGLFTFGVGIDCSILKSRLYYLFNPYKDMYAQAGMSDFLNKGYDNYYESLDSWADVFLKFRDSLITWQDIYINVEEGSSPFIETLKQHPGVNAAREGAELYLREGLKPVGEGWYRESFKETSTYFQGLYRHDPNYFRPSTITHSFGTYNVHIWINKNDSSIRYTVKNVSSLSSATKNPFGAKNQSGLGIPKDFGPKVYYRISWTERP